MAPSIETTSTLRQSHFPHRVYARARMTDDWTEQPYLYANTIEKSAAPEVSQAMFSWQYGQTLRPDKNEWETVAPKNLPWRFVKVVVDQLEGSDPIEWYGVFIDDVRMLDGDLTVNGEKVESGKQELKAGGMDILLAKFFVRQSYAGDTDDHDEIDRGLTFNSNDEHLYKPNRNSDGDGERFFFAKKTIEGDDWDDGKIVRYLVGTWLWINSSAVSNDLTWELDGEDAILAAGAFRRMVPSHNRTVKDLLDECLDRRRLLGYTVDMKTGEEGESDSVVIRPFTFVKTDIELDADGELPAATYKANPAVDLDFSASLDVLEAKTRYDATKAYSRVIVLGARLRSCWSCSATTILERGWSDQQEEDYEYGASREGDYPTGELEKLLRDSEFRKTDSLQPAFRQFVFMQDWDGKSGTNAVFPEINKTPFDATISAPYWRPGLRLEHQLPLKVGVDYSGDKIKDDATTTFNPDDREADYVSPLCLIPLPDSVSRYTLSELAGATKAGSDAEPPYEWSAEVRVLHEDAGLDLRVHQRPQHVICLEEFTKRISTDYDAEVNWKQFTFVVSARSDQHVTIVWPETPPPEPSEPELDDDELEERGPDIPSIVNPDVDAELPIAMPDAECWYVVPNSVVGIKDGLPQLSTSGGFIRDDRPRMKRIAKLAYGYYATQHRAFELTYRQLSNAFTIGQMIGTIKTGAKTVDVASVVTNIKWDLRYGSTSVRTDHAELDIRSRR